MKEQEENLLKQSSTDFDDVKKKITDLGQRSDVAERKISELDTGTQGLLEKLRGLENVHVAKMKDLDQNDADIREELHGLRSENASSLSQIQNHWTEKVNELNSTFTSTSSSIRDETKILSEKISQSQNQQTALENKVDDMDAGNQQLLEKLLAVEQDLDGKFRGVNDNSSSVMDRINSLDNENKNNAQRMVTLQESLFL